MRLSKSQGVDLLSLLQINLRMKVLAAGFLALARPTAVKFFE